VIAYEESDMEAVGAHDALGEGSDAGMIESPAASDEGEVSSDETMSASVASSDRSSPDASGDEVCVVSHHM
jgi:hypothetical protein